MSLFTVTNLSSGDLSLASTDTAKKNANLRISKGSYATTDELSYNVLKARRDGNVSISPTTFRVNNQFTALTVPTLIDGTSGAYVGQLNTIYSVTTYTVSEQNDSVLAQALINVVTDLTTVKTDLANLNLKWEALFAKVYGTAPVGT